MSIAPVKEPPEPRITQPAPELRDRLRRSRSCGMRPCPSKASTAPVREIGREALRWMAAAWVQCRRGSGTNASGARYGGLRTVDDDKG